MDSVAEQCSLAAENLLDAGCSQDFIEQFLKLVEQGEREAQFALLAKHRALLLDHIHENQKKVDSLDYLIYTMKKQDKAISSEGKEAFK